MKLLIALAFVMMNSLPQLHAQTDLSGEVKALIQKTFQNSRFKVVILGELNKKGYLSADNNSVYIATPIYMVQDGLFWDKGTSYINKFTVDETTTDIKKEVQTANGLSFVTYNSRVKTMSTSRDDHRLQRQVLSIVYDAKGQVIQVGIGNSVNGSTNPKTIQMVQFQDWADPKFF